MGKFIKTVTKEVVRIVTEEVVDLDGIRAGLNNVCFLEPCNHGRTRLVMSADTQQAIVAELGDRGCKFKNVVVFCGCPIDINNALEFGEIVFTRLI